MATTVQTYDLIRDLVEDVQAEQSVTTRKANTVTSGIGAVATAIAAGIAYLLEAGVDLPSWVTLLVAVCGMAVTTLGVSRTRNGMTDSVAEVLRTALVDRIDAHHDHAAPAVEQASAAAAAQSVAQSVLDAASSVATEELRAAAERIAGTGSLPPGSLG